MTASKLAAARAWLAQRAQERGHPHRYVPQVPTVLIPVQARYADRLTKREGV